MQRSRVEAGVFSIDAVSLHEVALRGPAGPRVRSGDVLRLFFRFAGQLPLRAFGKVTAIAEQGDERQLTIALRRLDPELDQIIQQRLLASLGERFRISRDALRAR